MATAFQSVTPSDPISMTDRLLLKIDCGQGNTLMYACDASQAYLLGSGEECHLRLHGSGISRRHCQLEKKHEGWVLTDLASTNGVAVNGKRILGDSPREMCTIRLSDGDRLGIGTLELTVQLANFSSATQVLLVPPPVQVSPSPVPPTSLPTKSATNNPIPNKYSNNKQANHNPVISKQASSRPAHAKQATTSVDSNEPPGIDLPPPPAIETESSKPMSASRKSGGGVIRQGTLTRVGDLVLRKKISEDDFGSKYLASKEGEPRNILFVRLLYQNRLRESSDEARLQRSISLLQGLNHRSIVRYIDSGEHEDYLYVAMEYCSGGSLKKLFQKGIKLSYRRALRLMDRILSGMELAHVNGMVHRNLSPSSILLERTQDNSYRPKITDFSLVKRFLPGSDKGVTGRGSVGGQWSYMPREQLLDFSNVLPQADVWSLGAILYEALTNRPPRPIPEGASPMNTILYSDAIPIQLIMPDIPKDLSDFLQRCLATEAGERFQNAMQMRAAMRGVADRVGIPLG